MKYVIEFEDEPYMREGGQYHYKCKQVRWVASDKMLSKLTPYDEAFAGYQESAYQKGLEDAWEACRKIDCYEIDGGYPTVQMLDLFDRDDLPKILSDYTAAEAIAKLKAYDEEQDSIKVGDEVMFNEDMICGFVIADSEKDGKWMVLTENGCVEEVHKSLLSKTGEHTCLVEKLLERMREG